MEHLEASEPRDDALLEKEAVAWFTRMSGKPSRAERRAFADWRQRSHRHEQAYQEVDRLWSTLKTPAQSTTLAGGDDLSGPLEKIRQHRERNRVAKVGAAAAGCLAAVLAGSWLWLEKPNFFQDMRADYVSAKAERRTITLPDGSTILMDADTALDDASTPGERRIRLLRGTASFVVKRSGMPFVVEAAGGESRVLGTRFDVALHDADQATVILSSGSVEVSLDGSPDRTILKPGESIDYSDAVLGKAEPVALDEQLAWHTGRLIFTNARLADVLAQVERYRPGRIMLADASLGDRRVSGNISLDDTDAALAAVQASVGFRMVSIGGRLTVVSP